MKPRVFIDTSALMAGLASPTGASHVILALAEGELITLVIAEEVLVEAERNLRDRLPRALPEYRRFLAACPLTCARSSSSAAGVTPSMRAA